jgi:hypothetical protein
VERVGLLRGKKSGREKSEAEDGEAERAAKSQKSHGSLGGVVDWCSVAVKFCLIGRAGGSVGLIVADWETGGRDKRTDSGGVAEEVLLTALIARELIAGFDANGGCDPDHRNEGDEAESHARMLEGERDRNEIDEEREPVFSLDGLVFGVEFTCVAQAAGDGQTQEEKTEAGDDHGRDVDHDGVRVHLFFKDVGGEEGEQREAEEEAKVGIEDEIVGLFSAVDEVMVVDPVNPDEGKRDEVEAQCGEDGVETGEAFLMGDFELEHHDGDDDGDDSVGEGFEASWGGDVVGHGCLVSGLAVLAEAYNDVCRVGAVAELEFIDRTRRIVTQTI